jgi:hypothetical protein
MVLYDIDNQALVALPNLKPFFIDKTEIKPVKF